MKTYVLCYLWFAQMCKIYGIKHKFIINKMDMKLNKRVLLEISKVSEVAEYLWNRQWCERNAGNISLNLTG